MASVMKYIENLWPDPHWQSSWAVVECSHGVLLQYLYYLYFITLKVVVIVVDGYSIMHPNK